MSLSAFLSVEAAKKIAELDVSDIEQVIKLSSLKQKANDILEYATKIAEGEHPALDLTQGTVRPLVIQAWSFVKDRNQYSGVYGLSSAEAAALRDRLEADPDAAVAEITQLVRKFLSLRGSPRAVQVTLHGLPSGAAASQTDSVSDDGGAAALANLIKRNSGIYGAYQFSPYPTGRHGPDAYAVELGGNLAVYGQNKRVVIAAARLISVHGRHHPPVVRYTRAIAGDRIRGAGDIPAKVWDGRIPPGAKRPVNAELKGDQSVIDGRGSPPQNRRP